MDAIIEFNNILYFIVLNANYTNKGSFRFENSSFRESFEKTFIFTILRSGTKCLTQP